MIPLNKKDDGRIITVDASSIISVILDENPTTGYRWIVDSSAGLLLLEDQYRQKGGGIGVGGTRLFKYQVPHSGTHELKMKLMRSWEGEPSVIDRFRVTIRI